MDFTQQLKATSAAQPATVSWKTISYAGLPSVEFTSCLALLAEDQMNSLPNVMKMFLGSCSVA